MKTSVYILRLNTKWVLILTAYPTHEQPIVVKHIFKTLIAAIDAACLLKVHVDNIADLPLRQYAHAA